MLQLSTGSDTRTHRAYRITFEAEGQPASLTIFREHDGGHLFLPFADPTRADETYGAGRYLEVHGHEGGSLLVDFNYAYNPYCAYNEAWSCPLPPPENVLGVPIRAGEKRFPGSG